MYHETRHSFCGEGLQPQEKLDLFYVYLGIEDREKFWKEANWKAKVKTIALMFIFNFILIYKIFRNQPLVKS
ncbi:hypothetical protein HGA64_00895 [Candidatus Falkowbacteria bacterium]|nr:hypothetical protein [Candidatus Falkowbacteria bacterium]